MKVTNVYQYIRHMIRSSLVQERPLTAAIDILRETFNLGCSRIAAMIVGWPQSFLGSGSKVLGSKGIFVEKKISIKRQAWIEAVFTYNEQVFTPSIKIAQGFIAADRLHISAINRIEIGENCLFGSGVYISDHNHGNYKGQEQSPPSEAPIKRKLMSFGPVIIGSNVWVGDNVIIVGPVKIGNGVVIGANSVVTKDIPHHVMAAGSPLRILKVFNETSGLWEKYVNTPTHNLL
jgi:acetyltransferase-like isoleucine patch superfamily enzyme